MRRGGREEEEEKRMRKRGRRELGRRKLEYKEEKENR